MMQFTTENLLDKAHHFASKADSWSDTSKETQAQLAVAYALMALARELQQQRGQ